MNESIRALYEVFAVYRKPKDILACECCWSDHEMRVVLKIRLSELSEEQLSGYAGSVFLTVGSEADFKYFLPRIFELSVNDEFVWPDPEVVLGKLRLAEWDAWPEHERAAVLRVVEEKFASVLGDEDSDSHTVDSWICALGRCVSDITPYLDQLLESRRHMLNFFNWNYEDLQKGKLSNGFWDDAPENRARVLAWLKSAEVKRLLGEEYGMMFHD